MKGDRRASSGLWGMAFAGSCLSLALYLAGASDLATWMAAAAFGCFATGIGVRLVELRLENR